MLFRSRCSKRSATTSKRSAVSAMEPSVSTFRRVNSANSPQAKSLPSGAPPRARRSFRRRKRPSLRSLNRLQKRSLPCRGAPSRPGRIQAGAPPNHQSFRVLSRCIKWRRTTPRKPLCKVHVIATLRFIYIPLKSFNRPIDTPASGRPKYYRYSSVMDDKHDL